jgi:hypothetical protein
MNVVALYVLHSVNPSVNSTQEHSSTEDTYHEQGSIGLTYVATLENQDEKTA